MAGGITVPPVHAHIRRPTVPETIDLNSKSPEEQQQLRQELVGLLKALDANRVDARDKELVWIKLKNGRIELVDYGYFRTYIQRNPDLRIELLPPEEIAKEEEKSRQAAIVKAEKAKLWKLLTLDEKRDHQGPERVDLEDLRRMTRGRDEYRDATLNELRAKLQDYEDDALAEASARPKRGPGRPRKTPVEA